MKKLVSLVLMLCMLAASASAVTYETADGRNVVLQLDFTVMTLSEIILFAE